MSIFEQAARITLALSVMSAALSLPTGYFTRNWRAMGLILLPGMVLMWGASAGMAGVLLGLPLLSALLVGAVMTPTDPVLARSIVTGRLATDKVPANLRRSITAESGANDGLALPLVMLPLLLMDAQGQVAQRSLLYLAWEVGGALAVGWLLGHATGFVFRVAHDKEIAEAKSLTATTMALALLTLAAVALLGADGILAVFVAGLVLNRAMKEEHAKSHEHFQDAVDRSLTLPIFILLGVVLPIDQWIAQNWPLFAAAGGIVLLRRLPAWLVLQALARPYADRRQALFAGWFGPIGVAALFYAAFASKHGGPAILWPLVSLVVTLSIVVHGITSTPLTRLLARAEQRAAG